MKSIIGDASDDLDPMPDYDGAIISADYVYGVLHLILMLVVIAYMIFSCVRKHRLSRFQWTYLINLACVEGM